MSVSPDDWESTEEYMDRVHGKGNWTVCWHDKTNQRKVSEGAPNAERVWHSNKFHDQFEDSPTTQPPSSDSGMEE